MAHEYFIAKKIFLKETEGKKVSRPIVRISIISIALAIVVNLLTIAVVVGFQEQVREKVSGFSSHAFITQAGSPSLFESDPLLVNDTLLKKLHKISNVKYAQMVAYKPLLLQSDKKERNIRTKYNKDSSFVQQEIQGALLKGVSNDYDWSFIKKNLVSGHIPMYKPNKISDEIVLSQSLANLLNFNQGDTVRAFFVKNNPVKKLYRVAGIFRTGLEEFDKKMVFGDLREVQQLNDWGLQANIDILDTLNDGYLVVKANVQGGNGYYQYDWGKGFGNNIGLKICPTADTTFRLIAKDYNGFMDGNDILLSIPDTAYISIKVKGINFAPCSFIKDDEGNILRKYLDDTGSHFTIKTADKTVEIKTIQGKGSAERYIGGYEVRFTDWSKMEATVKELKREFTFIPTSNGQQLKVSGIKESQQEIFMWLDFLDLNILIILTLMIVIGIVNVGAALLVIILVKTQFIGLMKALGSVNWQVRKIFLTQAFFIIGKGMIWGNAIGLLLCWLQYKFEILQLNSEVYYLSSVPISISVGQIVLLNVITLIICLTAMILPSTLITRISPTNAIKFK
ncbi:MAG: FtsX-like permease family protein [Bacteroidetes bacterium]|nr:FtsX-like permease family protein [Bacteroidota bacterium]